MGAYWDERAKENALYFVDDRLRYDSPDSDRFWAYGGELVDWVLDLFDLQVRPTDRLLDLGCGLGRLTRPLAERAGDVVGLDASAEMLNRARAHGPDLANVQWVQGDGNGLSVLEDGSIDGCLSLVVFHHIPDPEITLGYVREIGRVLRPGGWAAFQLSTDPGAHQPNVSARLSARARALTGRGPRGQDDPRWRGSWVPLDRLREVAEDSGLVLERIENPDSLYTIVLARRR